MAEHTSTFREAVTLETAPACYVEVRYVEGGDVKLAYHQPCPSSGTPHGPAPEWLDGLSDARIASALNAIHERPMQRWSIATLAALAGMSRSSFCERFTALVGRSPLRYHNEWRLALARDQLSRRGARVGEIGFSIGYASEAAFSRAYKALFGHSPRVDYGLRKETERQIRTPGLSSDSKHNSSLLSR